ncbi:MAG: ABC transporter permease [Treponema sp.]|nr:ABC transporter permease [Treponema sp.]
MEFLKKLSKQREFMIFVIVAGMFVIMSFVSPYFLTRGNLLALLLALSMEALIAVAMTNLMVSGGFDMSVGSLSAFTGVAVAIFMRMGMPVPLAVATGLIIGAAAGLFNGFIVAVVGINPFVTTLAGLSIFRGLTMIIAGGRNVAPMPAAFNAIGQTRFVGIQSPIWITLAFIIIGDIMLRKSRFFRQNYYIGGNEKTARLSGIPVTKMKIFNYIMTGLFAGLAGIVLTSRLGTASITAGTSLELRVITAVIIGGASLAGGEGTVLGAFFGSLLMALIVNALTLLGVDVYWQTFVIGATLLIAVLIDRFGKIQQARK